MSSEEGDSTEVRYPRSTLWTGGRTVGRKRGPKPLIRFFCTGPSLIPWTLVPAHIGVWFRTAAYPVESGSPY
jgi:hypothetical protein